MPPTHTRPRRDRSALLPAILVGLVVLGLLAALLPPPAAAAGTGEQAAAAPRALPGRVIVGLRGWTGAAARADVMAAAGATASVALDGAEQRTFLLRIPRGRSVSATIARLERLPGVRFAEPDWKVRAQEVADDPYVTNGSLWGMYGGGTSPANAYGSGAVSSWAAGAIGSRSVVVGIIDEGIDRNHPDLAANIWTNPYETAGDGIDNDGNGYVDDIHGWDFFYNDASVYDAGEDSHGTHVAGTIGGLGGNGIGVAGVNWRVTMISAKFLGPGGGYISAAIAALNYLRDLKTRHGIGIVATNNSWGGGGFSQGMLDAIRAAGDAGILFIAAAGNSTSNNDSVGSYPSNYDCSRTLAGAARGYDCVIAVASTTSTGGISSFSSYGATTVDLGAPGSSVWSTLPGNTYGSYSGTSMATPHVTGAAALCAATASGISSGDIRNAVVGGAQPLASLAGKTVTGGRLDVPSTLAICLPPTNPVSGAPSGLTATAVSATRIDLAWTDGATYETSYQVERAPDTG
ncbi:MAG: S8 family peptidase, partial [Chloroflexota bacterium]